MFGQHSVITFSSDTNLSGEKGMEMPKKVENNDMQIIIGTKILAKGLHFPNLQLIIVVDASAILA